jgi:uncharacterized membrane protein
VTTLALRFVLAPVFVVAISLVARRFGARAGGVVGGLPVIAGPILFVLALDKGTRFAADAAVGTMLGVVALIAFVLAYVAASRRYRWPVAITAGWAAFFAVLGALEPVDAGAGLAVVLACAACTAGVLLLPKPERGTPLVSAHPRHDLLFRAACTVVPVVVITGVAGAVGSHVAGLLSSFPIITPVIAAFTQAQHGPGEAARLLYGFTVGFFAYAIFCFVIAVTLTPLGIGGAFALGTVVALAVQAVSVTLTWLADRPLQPDLEG